MMSETGMTERRRVVYSVLAQHLNKDRLLEALWLWEQKYALTSTLELRKYVSELVTENDSPQLESAIYKSLTKATYFPGETKLLPDPYNEMQRYRKRCNGTFRYISPINDETLTPFSTVIFQHVLEAIFVQIKRKNSENHQHTLRQFAIKLPGMKLKDAQLEELTSWLNGKNNSLRLVYSEQFMSACISYIYIICCDKFGPVFADKIVAKAVGDADELDEAKLFSPRRLL